MFVCGGGFLGGASPGGLRGCCDGWAWWWRGCGGAARGSVKGAAAQGGCGLRRLLVGGFAESFFVGAVGAVGAVEVEVGRVALGGVLSGGEVSSEVSSRARCMG